MKRTLSTILIIALSLMLSLSGCGSKAKEAKFTVKVGSKDFTESLIVSEIYALALENAGYTVERKQNIAGSLVHTAITSGDIDLYPEYTGTGLLSILQLPMNSDPDEVYNTVKAAYNEQFKITWLDSTAVNDTQGIAVRTEIAKERGLERMSAQAVGGAVGHNPICIIVPCHRVIGANGSLTGYGGGIMRKKALLELEGFDVKLINLTV